MDHTRKIMHLSFVVTVLFAGITSINAGFTIGEYYVSYPLEVDWYTANRYCTYFNMYLIDIPHQDEYNRVLEVINKLKKNTTISEKSVWTSGTRLWDDPSYYWETTGQPLVYTAWSPIDPRFGDEKCIFLYFRESHLFGDVNCLDKYIFMCRKSLINPLQDFTCSKGTNKFN